MIDSGTFAIVWTAAQTEEEAAPKVIAAPRQRTEGQIGCAWVSDGNPVYAEYIRKVYRYIRKVYRYIRKVYRDRSPPASPDALR